MQFPHSSKNGSAPQLNGAERIEPTIGSGKPAPWDVTPEAAPAFEMVEDPKAKDDWGQPVEEAVPPLPETDADWESLKKTPVPPEDELGLEPTVPVVAPDEEKPEADPVIPSVDDASQGRAALGEKPKPVEDPFEVPEPPAPKPAPEKAGPGFLAFMKKGAEEERAQDAAASPRPVEAPTEEQLLARQKTRNRLIGAAAILMAVVVSSSFILDNEELVKGDVEVSTEIPPVPDKATTTIVPPVAPAQVAPVKSAVEKPAASKTETKPVKEAAKPAPKVEKKPEAKAPEKKPAAKPVEKEPVKAASQSGYFVQIVVTSSEQKAERMVRDLTRLKLPAYSEKIRGTKGPLWRVRIGHFKTEKEAKGVVAVLALNGYTGKHYIDKQ